MRMRFVYIRLFKTVCIVLFSLSVYSQALDTTVAKSNIDSLIKLSRNFINSQNFDKSISLLDSSAIICSQILGEGHPYFAKALFNKGYVYFIMGKYDEANVFYFQAKEIQEKSLGKLNGTYANTVNNIGIVYYYKQDFENAEKFYLDAKDIRAKVFGVKSKEYSGSLNNLALLYRGRDDHSKSLEMFLEAKGIWVDSKNKMDPGYAHIINNVALSYAYLGAYEKAEPLFFEAKEIWEKTVGKLHPDFALSLSCISFLYMTMGEYAKAEPLYLEVVQIKEKIYGKEHAEFASAINNLGTLYTKKGDFKRGESLFIDAMAIREKFLGKDNNDYAESLINLANLYELTNKVDQVEPLLIEAKEIWAKILGKEHSQYAISIMNLANHYYKTKDFQKAEPLYKETIEIRAKVFGKQHESYALVLYNLAVMYLEMGNVESGEKLTLEAREIWLNSFGKENENYINSLSHLTSIYLHKGKLEECKNLIFEMDGLIRILVEKSAAYSSENQMLAYLKTFERPNAQIQTFIQQHPSKDLIQLAYDNALFYNGYLMENAQKLANLSGNKDSLFAESFVNWKGKLRQLSIEYAKPMNQRKNINELELEAESLEKKLTQLSPQFSESRTVYRWEDVLHNLPKESAAIEFSRFEIFGKADSSDYVALILKSGDSTPQIVSLFSESELYASLSTGVEQKNSNLLSQIYSRGAKPSQNRSFEPVYNLIWKPINDNLAGVKKVYFAPSGMLHQLNFDAIKINEKTVLSDAYQLVRLGTTRSLIRQQKELQVGNKEIILYGAVDYNLNLSTQNVETKTDKKFEMDSTEFTLASVDRNSRQKDFLWNYLPGTELETKEILKICEQSKYKVQYFSKQEATEESFKKIGKATKSPQIIHLATHGFFFPDPNKSHKKEGEDEALMDQFGSAFKSSDQPMMRSGLLLSGANYAWKENKSNNEDEEDGILTAYEISQMNLSSTELVVLSACETGLGDIQGNEGVYGLQRAFKIAGVKYLIMSLWQVPDQQTSMLMTTFYKKLLKEKLTIPNAFHAAQKELREIGLDPYQWAGFVLVE